MGDFFLTGDTKDLRSADRAPQPEWVKGHHVQVGSRTSGWDRSEPVGGPSEGSVREEFLTDAEVAAKERDAKDRDAKGLALVRW